MTLSVVGLYVIGAAGMWRLAAVFPANRSRIAAMVVYVATPLVPGVLATGRWSVLVVVRRDAVDGLPAPARGRDRDCRPGFRRRATSPTASVRPCGVTGCGTWPYRRWCSACGGVRAGDRWCCGSSSALVLSAATLIAGGSSRTAGWLAATTAVAMVAGRGVEPAVVDDVVVVRDGRSADRWPARRWTGRPGVARTGRARLRGARGGPVRPRRRRRRDRRAWRLTWAVRAAALVLVFGALTVLADRDALPFDAPEKGMTLVPVALGMALASAARDGRDRRRRAGPRIRVASTGGGGGQRRDRGRHRARRHVDRRRRVGRPRTPLPALLGARLPLDPTDGDYRVLYIGDPRVLPGAGREYRDGISFAVVDDGPLDVHRPLGVAGDRRRRDHDRCARRIADGSTLRAGALFAPTGIRYIVIPEIDGAQSTVDDPVAEPAGLIEALERAARHQRDVRPSDDPGVHGRAVDPGRRAS